MNVNCKLTLTDEQRNTLKQRITGKPVKALATRAEVCELVNKHIHSLLGEALRDDVSAGMTVGEAQAELELDENAHPDCCRSVELMRTRMNRLQHHVDTRQ